MEKIRSDNVYDIWGLGRNPYGRLDNQYLRASYPYVETNDLEYSRVTQILNENFERNFNDRLPYLVRQNYVFFQTKEDAHLFQGLLYIY